MRCETEADVLWHKPSFRAERMISQKKRFPGQPAPQKLERRGQIRMSLHDAIVLDGLSGGKYIKAPKTARVGQGLAVAAVDENGAPIQWKAVSFSAGGGITQEQAEALDGLIQLMTFQSDPSEQYEAFKQAFGLE